MQFRIPTILFATLFLVSGASAVALPAPAALLAADIDAVLALAAREPAPVPVPVAEPVAARQAVKPMPALMLRDWTSRPSRSPRAVRRAHIRARALAEQE